MATKDQVIALHRAHPRWNAQDIANELECSSGYVRATAQREGLRMPRVRRSGRGETCRLLAEAVDALLELDSGSAPAVVAAAHRQAARAIALYEGREVAGHHKTNASQ